tara:strand:- start:143 stop:946 length:804 start_codon:yes stop_codon:yes gene_type:complete
MKTTTIAIASILMATAAHADMNVGGDISAEVKKNSTTDQYETVTKLGLSFDGNLDESNPAFGGFNFKSTDGGALALDEWNIGTAMMGARVSFGKQGGVFVEDTVDAAHASVAAPAMKESIQVEVGSLELALGLDDYKNDLFGNNDNLQAAYTVATPVGNLKGSIDYNIDSTEYLYGARVDTAPVDTIGGATLGGVMTYGTELQTLSFEADATAFGITAYLNGDENDMTENVGAGYVTEVGGLGLETAMNYNFDAEEVSPQVTLSFAF